MGKTPLVLTIGMESQRPWWPDVPEAHRRVPHICLRLGEPSVQQSSASASSSSAACPLTVSDAWVKAADTGMTAAFGTVANSGSEEATITAASTPAAGMTQLHETVDVNGTMEMKQVEHFSCPPTAPSPWHPAAITSC